MLYPRYSLRTRSGQKGLCLRLKLSSHEKLFQLPSTRVTVSKWKQKMASQWRLGTSQMCYALHHQAWAGNVASRLLKNKKKLWNIIWGITFRWKDTKSNDSFFISNSLILLSFFTFRVTLSTNFWYWNDNLISVRIFGYLYKLCRNISYFVFNIVCLLCVPWFESFTDAGSKTEFPWLQLCNSHACVSRNCMYKRCFKISFRH